MPTASRNLQNWLWPRPSPTRRLATELSLSRSGSRAARRLRSESRYRRSTLRTIGRTDARLGGRGEWDVRGLEDPEGAGEATLDLPLLEVYSPVREVWSGEVIAVAVFYEVANELEEDLADARRTSWLLVAGVFLASGLMLTGIVRAGGRTIERQRTMLEKQILESSRIATQNSALRRRAIGASARATSETDRILRRTSADLHDGPAQYIALAAMRLEAIVPETEKGLAEAANDPRGHAHGARRNPDNLAGAFFARSWWHSARRRCAAGGQRTPSPLRRLDSARLHRPRGPGDRRFLQDLCLSLCAGGPVECSTPCSQCGGKCRRDYFGRRNHCGGA